MITFKNMYDYTVKNNVYDNTRIIIVSDHGYCLYQFEDLINGQMTEYYKDVQNFYPLLLVKDFGSTEFAESDVFMTNADVPTLATQGVIDSPTNPFTGKKFDNGEKTAHDQYVIMSKEWDVENNNGNTFLPSSWASITINLWNKQNWKFYEKAVILDKHSF